MVNAQRFLDSFGYIADAPDGVKRLRELISSLAISGRLSLSSSDDSTLGQNLVAVASVRNKFIRSGRSKIVRGTRPLGEIAKPFHIPPNWKWVSLEQLAYPQAGFAFKSAHFNKSQIGLPLIRIRDVGQEFTETHYSGTFRDEFLVHQGDFLISMDGEFRVRKWTAGEALLNQRVTRLVHYGFSEMPFLVLALQDALCRLQGVKAYTTVDHLSAKQIAESPIHLPPIEEQKRIVAKVDELMALCDKLEAQQQERERRFPVLSRACHARFVESPTPGNLKAIFDGAETVSPDDLRKTILDLAANWTLDSSLILRELII